jgi:TPR repeat protein
LLLVGWRLLLSLLFLGLLCHPRLQEPALPQRPQDNARRCRGDRSQQQYSRNTQQRSASRRPAKIRCVSMAPSQLFRARLARAERGDIQAQAFVSGCYHQGNEGVTRDLALAFKFFRMAAEGGDTLSQTNLARLYGTGAGVQRDQRMASAWQASVGSCYYQGDEGVTKDLALAFKFFHMAAEGGRVTSQSMLASLYSRGEGVDRDERMASAWSLRAAKGGAAVAQFRTALRYQFGIGYDAPNIKEAVKWYQAAVAQGHADAQYNLGLCYDKGDGVPKNPGLALELYRKCAQHHELGDAKVKPCKGGLFV